MAFTWTGGDRWRSADMEIPRSSVEGDGLRALSAFDRGFVAVAGSSGNATVSRNGASWTTYDVMPISTAEPVIGLAAIGDRLFSVADSFDDAPSGFWTGSLSALGL